MTGPSPDHRGTRSSGLLERHVIVGEPDVLGVQVPIEVLLDDRLEFEVSALATGRCAMKVNVTHIHTIFEIG